jgi:hypothetical protein
LIYLRARYYNPADGRFQSRDTWGGSYNSPQSLNRWNYTQSNPVNYTDPSGHCVSGVVVDTIFCIAVIAAGAVIIAGVTAATYNYAVTQGGGIGGFNENNRGCIDMYQVMEAGKGASLGVLAAGGEALASLPLTGYYLAAAVVDKKSPAQVNIEILREFGLDDEYIATMRNPNFVAGKMGGTVATTYLSLRAFFSGLPTFKSTTIPLNVPQINNGVLSLRLVLNLPSIQVIGGSGELIYNGVAGAIPTYSMMSGRGSGSGDVKLRGYYLEKLKRRIIADGYKSIEDLKVPGETGAGGYELYVKPNGDIVVKPRSGVGSGEYTGYNIHGL